MENDYSIIQSFCGVFRCLFEEIDFVIGSQGMRKSSYFYLMSDF